MSKKQEKEIEELSQEQQLFNLEEVITKGKEAKIPYEFKYPNTDKIVGVQIRPLTTEEYTKAIKQGQLANHNLFIEILKIGLFDMEGNPFPQEILLELPAGVVADISTKITEISGFNQQSNEEKQKEVTDKLLGF